MRLYAEGAALEGAALGFLEGVGVRGAAGGIFDFGGCSSLGTLSYFVGKCDQTASPIGKRSRSTNTTWPNVSSKAGSSSAQSFCVVLDEVFLLGEPDVAVPS